MEILLATNHLGLGGSESYILTVAEELQRLGHSATIFAREPGDGVELAHERGLPLALRDDELPESPDIIYAQDTILSFELGARYPGISQAYAVHADEYDLSLPPQLPGLVGAIVVMYDRVEHRARAAGVAAEIVRLSQPVDTRRFAPRGPLNDPPRRALVLSNYMGSARLAMIAEACASRGIECDQLGAQVGRMTRDPAASMADVDIVFGKARVIIEAMACGRAAYVLDHNGGDGWVTADDYEAIAADNFGGQTRDPVTGERLRRDLAAYSPEMGIVNRELAVARHNATRHAQELVSLFRRLAPVRSPVTGPLLELARLARLQWAEYNRAAAHAREATALRERLSSLEAQLAEAQRVADERLQECEAAHAAAYDVVALQLVSADHSANDLAQRSAWLEERAVRAEEELARILASRRYRVSSRLARPLDSARRLVRPGRAAPEQ